MPGIVGLLTEMPRALAEPRLRQMLAALCHEPFYRTGTWIDESLGVYVGWLAREGSFSEGRPRDDEREGAVLVFSGEEFPSPGLGHDLPPRGNGLHAATSSYLVRLYEEDGSFPAGLNGRFHGLLADRNRGTVTLFNDRYAMHRLYYHEAPDAFYFGAEAKALLAVRPDLRRLDARALGEFVACGCVLEDRTLFEAIHVLPAASAWVFRGGSGPERRRYFRPAEWEDQSPLEAEPFYREFQQVFARNLPRYFEGSQPIGMSLTGGLDTRMIMAWHKAAPGSLPCYTFGGMFRDCRDVRVARQVARVSEQPHQVIAVGPDFLANFPRYAERTVYLTDGCVDVSHAPDLYVNERARQIAPVRMTGNYGSEVLRGTVAFKPHRPPAGLFRPEFLRHADQAAETFRSLLHGHPLTFALFRQAPWHHHGLLSLEQTQLALRSPYLDNDLVRLVFRAPPTALAGDDLCLRLIAEGHQALARIPTDRGLGGDGPRLPAAIRRGLAEFSRKAEYAYDYGMPQPVARVDGLLRHLHLERLFLGRHKFYHFRLWYRDALAAYVQALLLDPRSLARPYLHRTSVETLVGQHLRGHRNHTTEIHRLLTLELLHRLFIDS
jgi:asparagine synthase (glutamine-hydrolysing)